jgi:hypothetical protein
MVHVPAAEPVAWVFDPLPASGARRGGDPASHVFRQSVSSFVREVVQNANDQRIDAPEVHFRFIELSGDALSRFRSAAEWGSLAPHLRAAGKTRGGRSLSVALAEHERRGKLQLLVIEDRSTVGLTGDETTGESHFRALCKDTLFSHKQSESAGGSYGLGKSILWAFSGLSTVLFNSTLSAEGPGQVSPRLFGRAELPSHTCGGAEFAGSGWFGRVVQSPAGARAESVWRERAAQLADAMRIGRSEYAGTTIAILGFRDPTADVERSIEELAQEFREAVEREFWPALILPGNPLVVWVAGGKASPILPRDFTLARPFADAYRRRDSDRLVLEHPGDVVVREVPIEIPARRDGARTVKGAVRLCVRLHEEGEPHPLSGRVAWFRGPGMVVRYTDRRSLALGARPFHAVVACGDARCPEASTEEDHAIELFLRAAEPPGHDLWESTPSLKAEYKPGYAKALDALRSKVDDELKAIVVAQPRHGKQGPDRLRKRFLLGQRGGGGSAPSAFKFRSISARFDDSRWHFEGEIRPSQPAATWTCTLRITEIGEDGGEVRTIPIERLDITAGTPRLEGGVASITVDAPALVVRGSSVELARPPGALRAISLEIHGEIGSAP